LPLLFFCYELIRSNGLIMIPGGPTGPEANHKLPAVRPVKK